MKTLDPAALIYLDIYAPIRSAVQPALDRADRAIRELTTPEPSGRHRAEVA